MKKNKNSQGLQFIQDSVVARFKILIESTWKDIKLYLESEEFADLPSSPKGVINFAKEVDFLKYLSLRNMASHIYDQPEYLPAVDAAPHAVTLVKKIISRIEQPFHI